MPNLSIINFREWKRSIPFDLLKAGPIFNVKEGESIIVTYTSAAEKMRIFSAFIREGLENGDAVEYVYPDEESETVRAKLKEYGINVEEYEKDGTLQMKSVSEYFMTDGKFDLEKALSTTLNHWNRAHRKGYNHARSIEDVGDFSFINGQWQKYITDYFLNPKLAFSSAPNWVKRNDKMIEVGGSFYSTCLVEITAINIEGMSEIQVRDILKTFNKGENPPTRLIDFLEYVDAFSKRIGLSHRELLGRKVLFEFDPASDYENIVDDFVKEAMANAEVTHAFTYAASTIHKCLAKYPAIKFFTISISTSTVQPKYENEVSIPDNIDLILDFIVKITKTYSETNVFIVFDGLSELLISLDPERTLTSLRHALQILSSRRITALFLLNTSAHDPKTVSRLRSMFYNQLAHGKEGLQVLKLPKVE
jgi:KaiC/GvpD/RAD55 family RecA-like ATPase